MEDEDGALRLVGCSDTEEANRQEIFLSLKKWPGRSEAWQLEADTLKLRRRGGVVEARDGRLFSFEPPTVPVGGGEGCGVWRQDGYGGGFFGFRPYHLS